MNLPQQILLQPLRGLFPKEYLKITLFLSRGFPPMSFQMLVSLFEVAHQFNVPAREVLEYCEEHWEETWQHQDFEVRAVVVRTDFGDYDFTFSYAAITDIYHRLGIPNIELNFAN
jgi:hypothetical protein